MVKKVLLDKTKEIQAENHEANNKISGKL